MITGEAPRSDGALAPAELVPFVSRAMARDPENRFPDAATMRASLDALVQAPASPMVLTPLSQPPPGMRSRSWVVPAAVVAR